MEDKRRPRWDRWRLLSEVKVWEAVALSMDIEPELVNVDESKSPYSGNRIDEGKEFNDRLATVVKSTSNRQHFPTACTPSLNGDHLGSVRLPEFAAFATASTKWAIPSELRELVNVSPLRPIIVLITINELKKLASAEYWHEIELARLCVGVSSKFGDCKYLVPADARDRAKREVMKDIASSRLPAKFNEAGNPIYGQWLITPTDAVKWVLSKFPMFSRFPDYFCTPELRQTFHKQEADKRNAGRYTLAEAANYLTVAGERLAPMQDKLLAAAQCGDLPTYGPGESARYLYSENVRPRLHHEEAYWDDLNKWLADNEPRIKFRFDDPQAIHDDTGPQQEACSVAELAELFDSVHYMALESLFPDGKWRQYSERAKRNGLSVAKTGSARFNPLLAGLWWIDTQSPSWTQGRVFRRLAKHLPQRSKGYEHLLTGDYD